MLYRILADLTAVFHFLFILFIVFGGLSAFYRKWMAWVHLPAALWGVLIELFGWYCPLTPLENAFRLAADQKGYEGGFVQHYLMPLIYPGELTRGIQTMLGILVFAFNALVYGFVIFRWRKRPQ
jgi:hypothetical protein